MALYSVLFEKAEKLMLTQEFGSGHTLCPSHGRLKCSCGADPNLLAAHRLESRSSLDETREPLPEKSAPRFRLCDPTDMGQSLSVVS
jgi:hypothetical protein